MDEDAGRRPARASTPPSSASSRRGSSSPSCSSAVTSSILSNVGNLITGVDSGNNGSAPDPGGVTDSTDPDGKGGQVADAEATAPELLIIRTGQLEIEVADLDASTAAARSRVIAVGGYVSASEERAGDDATATVTRSRPTAGRRPVRRPGRGRNDLAPPGARRRP